MTCAIKRIHLAFLPILILLGITVTACNSSSTATEPLAGATTASSALPETTQPVAETPTNQPGAQVIFLAASDANPAQADAFRSAVTELTTSSQMSWEERSALSASDLTADTTIVVSASAANLLDLAAAAPGTRFVYPGDLPANAPENLTVITQSTAQQAFLAGFTGVVISTEWRAGLVALNDEAGLAYQQAFQNGGYYHCGICIPKYPPYENYPATVNVAGSGEVLTALQTLAGQGVETVVFDPALQTADTWTALASNPVNFITTGSVAVPDSLASQHVADLHFDAAAALRTLWPELTAGTSRPSISAVIVVEALQPGILTTGRLQLVESTATTLQDGWITPEEVPSE